MRTTRALVLFASLSCVASLLAACGDDVVRPPVLDLSVVDIATQDDAARKIDLASATPDLAASPDLASGDDLAAPDLASLDLAEPDFAMPDLVMPDLEPSTDLVIAPDLVVVPDLVSIPDLVVVPDLVAIPDLVSVPDITGCTVCGASCVDTNTDPANCGACGNVCGCGSTTCTAGVCDPVVLSSGLSAPYVLVRDGTDLFWSEDGSPKLQTVPTGGGATTNLYTGLDRVRGLSLTATSIYISRFSFNVVEIMPRAGGNVMNFSNAVEAGAYGSVVDGTSLYWVDYSTGFVRTAPLATAAPTTLATGQNAATNLVSDGTNLYWTIGANPGAVMKMPKTGGTPVTLASGQAQPFGLAVDGSFAYWTNQLDGTVRRVPIGGGATETIASGQVLPEYLAIDATSVYWTDLTAGKVLKAPLAGGTVVPIAINQPGPAGLAIDASCVYFANYAGAVASAGSIARAGK